MSGFKVEFSVLNLKATPGIYADAFANRPAAGYPGRVFIDTDNPSTGIYRDTGTVWVQIAETATSDVDTLQNVTDNGNTTTNSISVGHANTPVSTIDVRQSTSGLNNASNWTITANNNPTIASGATFGTNYVNAIYGAQTQLFLQNATIGNSGLNTAGLFINTLQSNAPGSPGIITVTQASTIRAISGTQTGIYYGGTNVGVTYSHVAALKTFQPINTGSAATVTNNYGLIVADSTPSSGTITYTNRWGIYQEGASDKNYFAANVLIKSTTDNGNALQVTGNANITGNLGLGTSSPSYKFDVVGSGKFSGDINFSNTGEHYLQNDASTTFIGLNFNSPYIRFATSNSERMRLDASGNLGLGVTPAATSNSYVNYQNGNTVIMGNSSDPTGYYTANATFNLGWKYIVGGYSSKYEQIFGGHAWSTAAFGTAGTVISFTQAMTLTSGGELLINTTTDVGDFKLQVSGNAYVSGNVAIGTTTPSAGVRLQVEGNVLSNNVGGNSFSINSAGANYGFILNNSANTFSLGYGPSLSTVGTSVLTWNSSGNVGINTTSPNAVSLLQMDSTTKGFLLPRMTDAQINAISNPPDGLMVYSTDQNHIAFWNASAGVWKKVSNSNL